jgi:cytochrome c
MTLTKLFKSLFSLCTAIAFVLVFFSCMHKNKEVRVLVFTKSLTFYHTSTPDAVRALQDIGQKLNISIDTSSNATVFEEENLKQYAAIVFAQTTGDILNPYQQAIFERFIQAGGGFLGIHSAADTEHEWPWYTNLVGAEFKNHPEIQPNKVYKVKESNHPAIAHLPDVWERTDEWYNFKLHNMNPDVQLLAYIDSANFKGGNHGSKHPITWYHEYDGGRSFYTAMGHTSESYSEPLFQNLLSQALIYVVGNNQKDYSKCRTQLPIDESRFTRSVLMESMEEPMEMAITSDGRVFVAERRGKLKLYDPATKTVSIAAEIPVWIKHEDGLLGVVLDPDFDKNNWLYLFYSPNIEESIQRVSRFTFNGDTLDMKSEKILLTIPVQRTECCHSGGSMAFDNKGHLWISVGDNTNPHQSNKGYSPVDEREGRNPFDAQKSSANTNDLRGKVLRIKPERDGTYSIPPGNLFAPGTPGCRPEIFAMGCRNPFRIGLDKRKGIVYWGDVGPDAGKDSTLGPRGYDEVNRATKPGFFGWPYFIADNKPYKYFDYATWQEGKLHDINNVLNNSPNNTGLKKLPAPQPAIIYYPYADSPEFPELGQGGRSAMAGPVYYSSDYPGSATRLPHQFDGGLLFYDWMRGWVFLAKFDENGKLKNYQRVLYSMEFSKPIDMELGPNGELYVLEYGENWFMANADARLVKIEYITNNRAPIAKAASDISVGGVPLTVQFDGSASVDPDKGDSLLYEWRFYSPTIVNSTEVKPTHTFNKPGIYNVILVVTDKKGNSSASELVITAGNHPPNVAFEIDGNSSFFWPGSKLRYKVLIDDKEDGKLSGNEIPTERLEVSLNHINQGFDLSPVHALGHQSNTNSEEPIGAALMARSDCKSCHHIENQSVGPSYKAIAARYKHVAGSTSRLAKKIVAGGGGVWGDRAMSAHPQIALTDAVEMVKYIFTLDQPPAQKLSASGTIVFSAGEQNVKYILSATYKDTGAKGLSPSTGRASLMFRNPKVEVEETDSIKKGKKKQMTGNTENYQVVLWETGSYLKLNNIDLTNVQAVKVRYCSETGAKLKLIQGQNTGGNTIGEALLTSTGHWDAFSESTIKINNASKGKNDLFLMLEKTNDINNKLVLSIDYLIMLRSKEPI